MLPKMYVIHCSELVDRTEACKKHLAERGIDSTFIRAPHGNTWGLDTRFEYEPGKRISPGHVSLDLAFWFAVQHMWLANQPQRGFDANHGSPTEKYILLEDDCFIPSDFNDQLVSLFDELEQSIPDWDLVFLGLAEITKDCWPKITERIGGPVSRLCRMTSPFGTHALLLRRRALPVLLDKMTIAQRNLDQQLWERVLQPGHLKWCAVLPSIVTQRTFDYTGKGKPEWAPSCIDVPVPEQPKKVMVPLPHDLEEAVPQPPKKLPTLEELAKSVPGPRTDGTYNDIKAVLKDAKGGHINDNPELDPVILAHVDPLPCFYRSEWTDFVGTLTTAKTVPLAACARYDDLCFTKIGGALTPGSANSKALSCEKCTERSRPTPPHLKTKLPLPEGHFNCSIAQYKGKLILSTRDSWGHSKVSLFELTNTKQDWTGDWTCTPISSLASKHVEAPRLEDGRLFVHQGKLHATFSLPDNYPPKIVQVGYVRFSEDLQKIEDTFILPSPYNNRYEKNWSFWSEQDTGRLRWVYSHKPELIVFGDDGKVWKSPNRLRFVGGVIRGGCPPIRVRSRVTGRDEMWSIFHGVHKRERGSVYNVGCLAFSPDPPYQVIRQTPVPFLWPDLLPEESEVVKRFVLFPGGAVVHQNRVFVSMGVDDTYCRIVSIQFDELDKWMKEEVESSSGYMQNTVLATGGRGD